MSLSQDEIYQGLSALAVNPEPEKEAQLLPHIQSWTSYFIRACNVEKNSALMRYILNRNPYLSKKELQAATCYPLHRMASQKTMSEADGICLGALLTSRYFSVSDLNEHNETVLVTAMKKGNYDIFEKLSQLGKLREAIAITRARAGGNILKEYLPLELYLPLLLSPDYEPTQEETVSIFMWFSTLNFSQLYQYHKGGDYFARHLNVYARFTVEAPFVVAVRHGCLEYAITLVEGNDELIARHRDFYLQYLMRNTLHNCGFTPWMQLAGIMLKREFQKEEVHGVQFSHRPLLETLIVAAKTSHDRRELIEMAAPILTKKIDQCVSTALHRWIFIDDYPLSDAECEAIIRMDAMIILHEEPRYFLLTYPSEMLRKTWGNNAYFHMKMEMLRIPATLENLREGYLDKVLQEANTYPLFREALLRSQFFKTLVGTRYDSRKLELCQKANHRLAFGMIQRDIPVSESDRKAFETYPADVLEGEALELYVKAAIHCDGLAQFIGKDAYRKKKFYCQPAVAEAMEKGFHSEAQALTVFTNMILTNNDLFFRYCLKRFPKMLIDRIPQIIERLEGETWDQYYLGEFYQPLNKAISERVENPELKDEVNKLMELFIRFFGEDKLQECVSRGEPHVPTDFMQDFFDQREVLAAKWLT